MREPDERVGITREIRAMKITADVSFHAEHLTDSGNRPGFTGILEELRRAGENPQKRPWAPPGGGRQGQKSQVFVGVSHPGRRPLLAGVCLVPDNPNEGFAEALERFRLLHISDTFHYNLHLLFPLPEHFHHFLAHFPPNIFTSKQDK